MEKRVGLFRLKTAIDSFWGFSFFSVLGLAGIAQHYSYDPKFVVLRAQWAWGYQLLRTFELINDAWYPRPPSSGITGQFLVGPRGRIV